MFASFTVHRPVAVIMVFSALCLFGVISLFNLQMDLLPPIEYPEISVITLYPGASPSEVEQLITKPIEEAVNSVPGITRIRSESIEGASLVVATLQWGINIDFALLKTREKVDLTRGMLPQDVYKPIVTRFDPNALPVMNIAITSSQLDSKALRYEVEKNIVPLFERIDGIGNAKVSGGKVRQIEVLVNRDTMHAYNVNLQDIVNAIQISHYNYPAGTIIAGDKELIIRTVGEFKNLSDIESVRVKTTKEGKPIFLKHIAKVIDGYKEVTSQSFINGHDCINLSIIKESGKNTVKVCTKALQLVQHINSKYTHLQCQVFYDGSEYIKQAIYNVISSALQGSVIAFIVLLFFLQNLISSFVIIIAIPVSLCITLLFLNLYGISINMMSLGGMTLCVGMLIDCGIVILETINQTKNHNYSFTQRIQEAIVSVSPSLVTSTLTSVVIFLPLILIKGIAGALFTQLAITVTVALIASLLVSIMLIPAIFILLHNFKINSTNTKASKLFYKLSHKLHTHIDEINKNYIQIVQKILPSLKVTKITTIIILTFGCLSLLFLDKSLMPHTTQKQFLIRIEMPRGTPLSHTVDFCLLIDSLLSKNPAVKKRLINAGYNPHDHTEYFGKEKNTNIGEIAVTIDSDADDAIKWLRKNLHHSSSIKIDYNTQNPELLQVLPLSMGNIIFECTGQSLSEIEQAIQTFLEHNKVIPGVKDIIVDVKKGKPEIAIHPDKEKLTSFGLSLLDVASTLHTAFYGSTAGKYFEHDNEFDVTVRFDAPFRDSIDDINAILLHTQNSFIPLKEIADVKQQSGYSSITRKDQQHYIAFYVFVDDGYSYSSIIKSIKSRWENTLKNSSVSLNISPDIKETQESIHDLIAILILSIVLIFMIIASQFESLSIPMLIMSTIPISLCGSSIFLFITNNSLNIMSLMGSVILIGTIVNNVILLTDTVIKKYQHSEPIIEFIIAACNSRFLSISMTSLTTLCGLLPLALGLQQGSDLQSPLAISIIGGMIIGTLFIMVVYPSILLVWLLRKK
ncbi:MAG: efflux RND transporter permease subunit [Spirochaetes bacterium]|nr:efflux RND transporter permease subunit [Spirochaetota bacterium]